MGVLFSRTQSNQVAIKPEAADLYENDGYQSSDYGEWGKGPHEVEVFLHEDDLKDRVKNCKKNPGHAGFIPAQSLTIRHLPVNHRRELEWNFIQTVIFLTVRIVVKYTSEDRLDGYCDNKPMRGSHYSRLGTGLVYRMSNKFTEYGRCPCGVCKRFPDKAETRYGALYVKTAKHVVFNNEECKYTTCDVEFYGDNQKGKSHKLGGWKVDYSNSQYDYCNMLCITHDENVYNRMEKMMNRYHELGKKLFDILDGSEYVDMSEVPVLCVSHPHGKSKHVSVGVMTSEQNVSPYAWGYSTDTCNGSSGSAVIRLGRFKNVELFDTYLSIHSRKGENQGENQSGCNGWRLW